MAYPLTNAIAVVFYGYRRAIATEAHVHQYMKMTEQNFYFSVSGLKLFDCTRLRSAAIVFTLLVEGNISLMSAVAGSAFLWNEGIKYLLP